MIVAEGNVRFAAFFAVIVSLLVSITPCRAGSLLINEYTLITFGGQQTFDSTVSVHGKSLFAGDLTLNTSMNFANSPSPNIAGQTSVVVLGNLNANTAPNVQQNTSVAYGGALNGSLQPGTPSSQLSPAEVGQFNTRLSELRDASAFYAGRGSTATFNAAADQNNNGVVTITGKDASGAAYLNVSASDIFKGKSITVLDSIGIDALVINVTDIGSLNITDINANFNLTDGGFNGILNDLADDNDEGPKSLLWNFAGLTDLTLGNNAWLGNILAPDAALNKGPNNIWGSVAVDALSGQGQIHAVGGMPPIIVPNPTAFTSGLAAMLVGMMWRRRR